MEFSRLLFLILLPIILASNCQIHPFYNPSLKPVLISQWDFSSPSPTAEQSVYIRRHSKHTYAPIQNENANTYANLDLFYPLSGKHNTINMSFQRSATVYVFVSFSTKNFNPKIAFSLFGWKSVGWAVLVRGQPTITYGIHQKLDKTMAPYAYVFKKKVKQSVSLPSTNDIQKATSAKEYIVLIAEADGKPSPNVGNFKGVPIKPNARCPDALHDLWVTTDPNKDDKDTQGKLFRTWHPNWDPCFWCAYDHDHGGNPGIFGYKPMYDYTAFKNGRQQESNPGFKGFIFSFGGYWVYFNLHIQASQLRRVFVRFHTMNIVIAEKKTNKIVADLRFKADFGFVAVQTKKRKLFPINDNNRGIRDNEKMRFFRTINLLNPERPNTAFLLKKKDLMRGVYEEWQTVPICADSLNPQRGVQFTLKTPGTGIMSLDKPNKVVYLGRTFRNQFYRSLNLYRTVKFRLVTIADGFCPGKKNGVFYTDPSGKTVVAGPGKNAVRQYIQPGFSMLLTGKHEVTDPWNGVYTRDKKGFFRDHGYGLDPNVV